MRKHTYHVGIDFGTSQTKICINNFANKFHFHKFKLNSTYFLPSTIQVDESGNCSVGLEDSSPIRYFKMAALHDEQFDQIFNTNQIESGINYNSKLEVNTNSLQSTRDDLAKYPELCCIIYLAQIISELQEALQHVEEITISEEVSTSEINSDKIDFHQEKHPSSFERILSLFKKKQPIQQEAVSEPVKKKVLLRKELRVTNPTLLLTIGIPTEYDSGYNILRRHKMFQMLLMAKTLADEIGNVEEFKKISVYELIKCIQNIYEKNIVGNDIDKLKKLYEDGGLFVIAETTAGIEPIRNERKRMLLAIINQPGGNWQEEYDNFKSNYAGYYMTRDIGAGTTDVSFFQMITSDKGEIKINYFSSQPIPYASNQIISKYLNTTNFDEISNFDYAHTMTEEWSISQQQSREELYRIINGYGTPNPAVSVFGRVKTIFNKNRLSIHNFWYYEDPPPHKPAKGCFVYGGGSRFNEFGTGVLTLLHHPAGYNGTTTSIRRLINGNELINNLPLFNKNGSALMGNERSEISNYLDMLIVALGLAMLIPGNRGDNWLCTDEYLADSTAVHIDTNKPIFDLFKRQWI